MRWTGLAGILLWAAVVAGTGAQALAADTLAGVRRAGVLRCSSNGASEDYTRLETHGDITDLAEEVCKAVAIAVLGPKAKLSLHVSPDEQGMLQALRQGRADLAIGVAPSLETAIGLGVGFGPPIFYDGLRILARNEIGALTALSGRQVCFIEDANIGESLQFALHARGVAYLPFPFEEVGEMLDAASSGHCAAIAGNASQLINLRFGLASIEKHFHLLADTLTVDPIAPTLRADDRTWAMTVTAVVSLLIDAEEDGVTAANVERMAQSDDPRILRLIGPGSRGVGRLLGLSDGWATAVLKAVGNYGEIYDRSLGPQSDFDLPRGPNRLCSRGGMLAAPQLY